MGDDMSTSELTTGEQLQSIWALGGLRSKQLAKRVWNGINDNDLLGLASQLAYSYILAIFPLFLFLLSLFGLFASRGTALQTNLLFYLQQVLPPAGYQVMLKTIQEVTRNTGTGKITFGILLALFTASGGMTAMISGLNRAYVVKEARSYIKVRALAILLTIVLSALVLTALILVLVGGWAANAIGGYLHLGIVGVIGWKILQWVAALFFVTFAFSLIYYFGPNVKEQHWYWITPGSVLGVLLWVAASFGFRMYLHFFNSYSKTYGSLGAVMILLVWFYVTGFAFLVGGEVNAEIEHAAAEHGHPEAKAEGEKVAQPGKRAA
jgi:membrane protein